MRLNKKNRGTLIRLLILCSVLGTLVFSLILRMIPPAHAWEGRLSLGPIGFDAYLISAAVRVNPGTFLGLPAGYLLFRSLP